jgi:hypothetical protein
VVAVLSSSEGISPKIIDITVATIIEIRLLTDGITTETESFTGSVKNIIMITLM